MKNSTETKKTVKTVKNGRMKEPDRSGVDDASVKKGASDTDHIVLVFEDNQQANIVFGQFD